MMTDITPLIPQRIRHIKGSFAFIEHRFLRGGFWQTLSHMELLLYLFLIVVSDRNGVSFYSYDRICSTLHICLDDYILARNGLIAKDLIAFDGHLFQVLTLPDSPVHQAKSLLKNEDDMLQKDPATIHRCICEALGKDPDELIPSPSR